MVQSRFIICSPCCDSGPYTAWVSTSGVFCPDLCVGQPGSTLGNISDLRISDLDGIVNLANAESIRVFGADSRAELAQSSLLLGNQLIAVAVDDTLEEWTVQFAESFGRPNRFSRCIPHTVVPTGESEILLTDGWQTIKIRIEVFQGDASAIDLTAMDSVEREPVINRTDVKFYKTREASLFERDLELNHVASIPLDFDFDTGQFSGEYRGAFLPKFLDVVHDAVYVGDPDDPIRWYEYEEIVPSGESSVTGIMGLGVSDNQDSPEVVRNDEGPVTTCPIFDLAVGAGFGRFTPYVVYQEGQTYGEGTQSVGFTDVLFMGLPFRGEQSPRRLYTGELYRQQPNELRFLDYPWLKEQVDPDGRATRLAAELHAEFMAANFTPEDDWELIDRDGLTNKYYHLPRIENFAPGIADGRDGFLVAANPVIYEDFSNNVLAEAQFYNMIIEGEFNCGRNTVDVSINFNLRYNITRERSVATQGNSANNFFPTSSRNIQFIHRSNLTVNLGEAVDIELPLVEGLTDFRGFAVPSLAVQPTKTLNLKFNTGLVSLP